MGERLLGVQKVGGSSPLSSNKTTLQNKLTKFNKIIKIFLYYSVFIFIFYTSAFSITINNTTTHNINQTIDILIPNNSVNKKLISENLRSKISATENLFSNNQFSIFSNLNKNNNYNISYDSFLINNKTLINKIKEINIDSLNSTPLFLKKINNFYTGLYISQNQQNLNFTTLNSANPLILNKFTNDNYQLNPITLNPHFNYNLNNYSLNQYNFSSNTYTLNYFLNFKGVSIKLNKKSTLNTTLTITTDININQLPSNIIDKSKVSLTIKF